MKGRVDNIHQIYNNYSLFVLTSYYEGLPLVLLEAQYAKLPVVSFDCPTGPSDLIDNEVNGLLVPVRDSQQLSLAMSYMYEHPERARKMGANAKDAIRQKCQADSIARKMIEICESSKNKRK